MTISFAAGQLITSNQMNLLAPIYMVKSTPQNVTNSATLVNDLDIVCTIVANQTVNLALFLGATNSVGTTAGIKLGWLTTGTVALVARQGMGPDGTSTTPATHATMHAYQFNSTAAANYGVDLSSNGTVAIQENIIFTGGASGGTITLQWAQNAAGASTTTVTAGTFAIVRYVS